MFLQEYMQKFVERTDMSDEAADKNTEDVIREAIHMHHQVLPPLCPVCVRHAMDPDRPGCCSLQTHGNDSRSAAWRPPWMQAGRLS
jgi:hypothetical protein